MKYLYTTPLPESAQTSEQNRLQQQLAQLGLLNQSGTDVKNISSAGGDLSLEGQYRYGQNISEMLVAELSELAGAGLGTLPLYRDGGRFDDAGYYAIETLNADPLHANRREVYRYNLTLVKEGARASNLRAVRTSRPLTQADHPFGNTETGELAIPSAATEVQWLDEETEQTSTPTLVETRATEGGSVDVYDAWGAPFQGPTLVYNLPYGGGSKADVRAFDARGNQSKLDSDGVRTWQICYDPAHDYAGERVLDTFRAWWHWPVS